MGDGKKGGCGCGPGGALTPMAGSNPVYGAQPPNPRRAAAMFGADSQDNPLQPTATGHTLPFSSNGVFRLPRHIVEEIQPHEPAPRPSQGMGRLPHAVLAAATCDSDPASGEPFNEDSFDSGTRPKSASSAGFLTEVRKNQIRNLLSTVRGRRRQ